MTPLKKQDQKQNQKQEQIQIQTQGRFALCANWAHPSQSSRRMGHPIHAV
jgi:hypothetical protein